MNKNKSFRRGHSLATRLSAITAEMNKIADQLDAGWFTLNEKVWHTVPRDLRHLKIQRLKALKARWNGYQQRGKRIMRELDSLS